MKMEKARNNGSIENVSKLENAERYREIRREENKLCKWERRNWIENTIT